MSEEKKDAKAADVSENSASVKEKKQDVIKTAETDKAKAETATKAAEAEAAAQAALEAEVAAKAALAKAEELRAVAEKAAEAEYKAIAEQLKAEAAKAPDYTFKRQSEEIFRRDMGEPEFWLDKQDRFPIPILSAEQQEELTRKAEIPTDNTPKYNPENILSPEYAGVSNYESGVGEFLEETRQKLAKLRNDPLASEKEIHNAENDLIYLESLHENYFLGMNVFRTAKGGRSKIK